MTERNTTRDNLLIRQLNSIREALLYEGYPISARVIDSTVEHIRGLSELTQVQQDLIAEHTQAASAWENTARQHAVNAEYYRALLVQIGNMFGAEARTADDGLEHSDVLVLKVPDLVAEAIWKTTRIEEDITEAFVAAVRQRSRDMADAVLRDLNIVPVIK